ncbi:hypothetical protein BC827DRAFT_756476 [Russula dissimulans]|nr:hypothetical protein BC827DRAFT_756476 [Russula dissimulans]
MRRLSRCCWLDRASHLRFPATCLYKNVYICTAIRKAGVITYFPPSSTYPLTPAMVMGSLMTIIDLLVLVSSLVTFLTIRDYQRRGRLPYPPGPRPLPIIGNLLDIPMEFSWLTFTQLSKKHGDVISFHVFGQVVVVLNSIKATKDLFERRGEIYSSRPAFTIHEIGNGSCR